MCVIRETLEEHLSDSMCKKRKEGCGVGDLLLLSFIDVFYVASKTRSFQYHRNI